MLTEIVNSAYPSGNPIPADPSKYQPATPFSSLTNLAATATAATTGSPPRTTPTTTLTAADATPSDTKTTATSEEPKPLANVVRRSYKAVPQSGTRDDTPSSTSDAVASVGNPTKDELHETTQTEATQPDAIRSKPEADSGSSVEADKS